MVIYKIFKIYLEFFLKNTVEHNYKLCSTIGVIHKNSLLLNQHNGDDASKKILKEIFTRSIHKLCTFQHTVYMFRLCCAINTRTKVRNINSYEQIFGTCPMLRGILNYKAFGYRTIHHIVRR